MKTEVKDVYNAIQRYENRKKTIQNNTKFNAHNKKLYLDWLQKKEDELKNRRGRDVNDQIRWAKTLNKYLDFFVHLDLWFKKPFNELTQQDLIQVREDLENGKLTNKKGQKFSKYTRLDYYNKVFKSDFFDSLGLKEIAKKIFVLEKSEDEEVAFFTKEDIDSMIKHTTELRNKLFLYFLFDVGTRVGTALNIRVADCEKRYNLERKQNEYLIHIKKDYTKSKSNANIPLLLPETNELLNLYLQNKNKTLTTDETGNKHFVEKIPEPIDFLFDFSYSNARKLIERVARVANILTKPNNKKIKVHDFRKSCATYMLSKGFRIDYVKSRLQHKPSSTIIDRYVSYLGLDQEKEISQFQESNYAALLQKYKETEEKVKVLSENLKHVENKFDEVMKDLERVTPILDQLFEEKIKKQNHHL